VTSARVFERPSTGQVNGLVQFIVDTTGRAERSSLHFLKKADAVLTARAPEVIAQWKFSPALRDGCPVRQLFQTGIEAQRQR
jgi:MarR-like DNA-binding transcriptional regulator SgrR of sgrS sRNA